MNAIETLKATPEEIAMARRFFAGGEGAPLHELMDDEELGDLFRTVVRSPQDVDVETAIERHPFASDSRKAKMRVCWWFWNGRVQMRNTDPRRFDPDNRDKFIRAMRVFVGLPPEVEE